MPKPLFNKNISVNVNTNLNTNTGTQLKSGVSSDRVLLQKRSKKYIQNMTSIDTGTLTATKGYSELVEKLKDEFGPLGIVEYPLGIVSKCYLGHPYEVHILDLSGTQIIEHFKKGENLPAHLEKARALAMHNAYSMIEVYSNKMILIKEDGSTIKL